MWWKILGVVAGVVAWAVFVKLLNLGLRHGWADYAAVEKAMAFTVPMMIARLTESALSSFASGYLAVVVARGGRSAALGAGLVLLLIFAPYHYQIWGKFPIWYHLTFFTSLPLLSWAGGTLVGRRPG